MVKESERRSSFRRLALTKAAEPQDVQGLIQGAKDWHSRWASSPVTQRIYADNMETAGLTPPPSLPSRSFPTVMSDIRARAAWGKAGIGKQVDRIQPDKWSSSGNPLATMIGLAGGWYPAKGNGKLYNWALNGGSDAFSRLIHRDVSGMPDPAGLAVHETTHQSTIPPGPVGTGVHEQLAGALGKAVDGKWSEFISNFKQGIDDYSDSHYTSKGYPVRADFYPQAAQIARVLEEEGIPYNSPDDYGNKIANRFRGVNSSYTAHPYELHAELNRLRHDMNLSPDKRNWTPGEADELMRKYFLKNPDGWRYSPFRGESSLLSKLLNTVAGRTSGRSYPVA